MSLSKLVFISHCVCSHYTVTSPATPSVSFHSDDPNAFPVDFEQVIILAILFTALFDNRIMIYSMSAAHVPMVLSCLRNPSALAAEFKQVIVPVICFLPCLLTRYLFVSCDRLRLLFIYGVGC